jgi:hypothetical protein
MISRKENFQKEHMQNYDVKAEKKIQKEQMQTMMLI